MCEGGERRWGKGGERGGRERWVVTRVCEGGETRIKGGERGCSKEHYSILPELKGISR